MSRQHPAFQPTLLLSDDLAITFPYAIKSGGNPQDIRSMKENNIRVDFFKSHSQHFISIHAVIAVIDTRLL